MSAAVAATSATEPSPEVDFEPYIPPTDEPLPTPKELVKKGISLNLIARAVGLGGLRFTPVLLKERKKGRDVEGKAEWEDDGEEEEEGEGELEIEVQMYATMTRPERKEMMDVLEENMKVMYQQTKEGWSRTNKTKEMSGKTTRMRFLLARPIPSPSASSPTSRKPLAGFLAFTAIEEPKTYTRHSERVPVIYCWEIQITPRYRGTGLAGHLMEQLHVIGREIGMRDVRLTVFRSNARARRFYEKLGYVIRCDDPRDDFVIMQKLV
ncbi:hypothetical protein EV426DRAFT_55121 [Tirmania nivea]|nr:hypothetical protein EV426DRAFT_55121 [Tirmania nivea]